MLKTSAKNHDTLFSDEQIQKYQQWWNIHSHFVLNSEVNEANTNKKKSSQTNKISIKSWFYLLPFQSRLLNSLL